MTNRAYVNGRNFEYRIKQKLEADGWTVFRTAGSHTPCDLIAFRPRDGNWRTFGMRVLFVQAKGGDRKMTRKAQDAFRDFALAHGARPLLVTKGLTLNWLDRPSGAAKEEPE